MEDDKNAFAKKKRFKKSIKSYNIETRIDSRNIDPSIVVYYVITIFYVPPNVIYNEHSNMSHFKISIVAFDGSVGAKIFDCNSLIRRCYHHLIYLQKSLCEKANLSFLVSFEIIIYAWVFISVWLYTFGFSPYKMLLTTHFRFSAYKMLRLELLDSLNLRHAISDFFKRSEVNRTVFGRVIDIERWRKNSSAFSMQFDYIS